MTRVAVNSTPKSFKGSKRNKLIVDPEDLQQSKADLNLIDNNIIDEIEEKELILTPNSLFNNDTNNIRKWSPEDLKDSEVQKSVASNGCIVFFNVKKKIVMIPLLCFAPKLMRQTLSLNSNHFFQCYLAILDVLRKTTLSMFLNMLKILYQ
jgi:hypothetical protein